MASLTEIFLGFLHQGRLVPALIEDSEWALRCSFPSFLPPIIFLHHLYHCVIVCSPTFQCLTCSWETSSFGVVRMKKKEVAY
jgi:hypothetical protein